MAKFLNHAAVAAPRNGTTTHTVGPNGTGGTVIAGTAFTPTAGNLLVCFVEGAVTSSTPSGWTLPSGGSAVNFTGLYVWRRTAAGGDVLTTTHNGSNYPVVFDFYEFAPGSTFTAASAASAVTNGAAGPSLTGQTGTHLFTAALGQAPSASSTVNWASGVETVDTYVSKSGTDGYLYGLAYVEDSTAASFSDAGTSTGDNLPLERLVAAITVIATTGPNSGNATGSWSASGSAGGTSSRAGTANGSWTAQGSAMGQEPVIAVHGGGAIGLWNVSGDAAGEITSKGEALGAFDFAGTAAGSAPTVGQHSGSAAGYWSFGVSAEGSAPVVPRHEGSAAGDWAISGDAASSVAHYGAAEVSWVFAGDARGPITIPEGMTIVFDGEATRAGWYVIRDGQPVEILSWSVIEGGVEVPLVD